jgi:hypothetical protein
MYIKKIESDLKKKYYVLKKTRANIRNCFFLNQVKIKPNLTKKTL